MSKERPVGSPREVGDTVQRSAVVAGLQLPENADDDFVSPKPKKVVTCMPNR